MVTCVFDAANKEDAAAEFRARQPRSPLGGSAGPATVALIILRLPHPVAKRGEIFVAMLLGLTSVDFYLHSAVPMMLLLMMVSYGKSLIFNY